jgi:hypothetical protein
MTMAKKKKGASPVKPKKGSKRSLRDSRARHGKTQRRVNSKLEERGPIAQSISLSARSIPPPVSHDSRVFTIEIDSIRAETTIGDLIVAFPRTRDVLMKHGLRFDVEEAGYLYMTLNVFSAIHGLALTNLIQELDVASKELPPPPLIQPLRQIVTPPTS